MTDPSREDWAGVTSSYETDNPFAILRQKRAKAAKRRARKTARECALLFAQDHKCFLCGQMFSATRPPTLEHVRPRHLGGKTRGNVLLAHELCNRKKGGRMPTSKETDYLERVNLILHGTRVP
jgi:5-methylcytosine-specific restriction endonuclease McrA